MTLTTRPQNGAETSARMRTDEVKPRRRRRWTAEQKADLLARFAASGFSVAEFCRRSELCATTFGNWARRRQGTPVISRTSAFAEVRLAGPAAAAELVITLGPDVTVRVPPGLDVHWVGQLLQAMRAESRSC